MYSRARTPAALVGLQPRREFVGVDQLDADQTIRGRQQRRRRGQLPAQPKNLAGGATGRRVPDRGPAE